MKLRSLFVQVALLLRLGRTNGDAAFSAMSILKSMDYRYFVAGGTCAAISHGITTPIDVVKTRIQADPAKYSKGMRQATVAIIKEDGPQVLLGGLGPTVVGYGIEGAMKFGVYEICKPLFNGLFLGSSATEEKSAVAFLLASITAGAVAALILCPMESTRIRIVTDPAYAGKGLLNGLPKLVSEEGLWSTFSGLWAMLAKQVPYTFGKQVSFDVIAGFLYAIFQSVEVGWLGDGQTKWVVSVMAAFMASIIACIFSQPGDMLLTETYRPRESKDKVKTKKGKQQVTDDGSDRSFGAVSQRIYQKGGMSGFFTGTGARIVHVGMIITSQLVIYDVVKQMLGLPATGSH
jgi:solute carrier family 25 phosphate transporter 3